MRGPPPEGPPLHRLSLERRRLLLWLTTALICLIPLLTAVHVLLAEGPDDSGHWQRTFEVLGVLVSYCGIIGIPLAALQVYLRDGPEELSRIFPKEHGAPGSAAERVLRQVIRSAFWIGVLALVLVLVLGLGLLKVGLHDFACVLVTGQVCVAPPAPSLVEELRREIERLEGEKFRRIREDGELRAEIERLRALLREGEAARGGAAELMALRRKVRSLEQERAGLRQELRELEARLGEGLNREASEDRPPPPEVPVDGSVSLLWQQAVELKEKRHFHSLAEVLEAILEKDPSHEEAGSWRSRCGAWTQSHEEEMREVLEEHLEDVVDEVEDRDLASLGAVWGPDFERGPRDAFRTLFASFPVVRAEYVLKESEVRDASISFEAELILKGKRRRGWSIDYEPIPAYRWKGRLKKAF